MYSILINLLINVAINSSPEQAHVAESVAFINIKQPDFFIDTVYLDSKTSLNFSSGINSILRKIPNITPSNFLNEVNENSSARQIGFLNNLNKSFNTKIFSKVKVVIETCYCKGVNCEKTENFVALSEWYFENEKEASLAMEKIKNISDTTVPYIFQKYWIWHQEKNRIFFIKSNSYPPKHPYMIELEKQVLAFINKAE